MAQVHTYVMERLNRWVVWNLWMADLLTPSPAPRSVKSWWHTMVTRPNMKVPPALTVDRAPCPVDEIEAGATDICVKTLPKDLRDAVVESYLSTGTAVEKAGRLHCSRRMFFYRLTSAYTALLGLMQDYEVGILRVDVERANAELPVILVVPIRRDHVCESGDRVRAVTRGIA